MLRNYGWLLGAFFLVGCAQPTNFSIPESDYLGYESFSKNLQYREDCNILITGKIDSVLFSNFQALIQKDIIKNCKKVNLVLASPGGSVYAAMSMGALIREKGYSTAILDGNQCSSACGLVFISGLRRTIGDNPRTRLGLHRPSITNGNTTTCTNFDEHFNLNTHHNKYLNAMLGSEGALNYLNLSNQENCNSMKYFYKNDLLNAMITN